jgi:hypothetical protein
MHLSAFANEFLRGIGCFVLSLLFSRGQGCVVRCIGQSDVSGGPRWPVPKPGSHCKSSKVNACQRVECPASTPRWPALQCKRHCSCQS